MEVESGEKWLSSKLPRRVHKGLRPVRRSDANQLFMTLYESYQVYIIILSILKLIYISEFEFIILLEIKISYRYRYHDRTMLKQAMFLNLLLTD